MTVWLLGPGAGPWLRLAAALAPLAIGFGLDLLWGDPRGFPHPVVFMGRAIARYEKVSRPRFPQTPRGQLAAGALLAFSLPTASLVLSGGLLVLAARWGWGWALALEGFWCWQALALRDLKTEAMAVYTALKAQGLPAARRAVGRIVGRDTACLNREEVTRAAVETVAENLSDGVIAPLFYMALGGAPLALWYKAVNTLDSMVGYKNERYLHFGRAAARSDDAANFLPSRLAAFLLMGAAALCGCDAKNALRIWKRDRFRHASPNSAQTESACAGALGVRLGGDASYFGRLISKPFIGEDERPIRPEDIPLACRLLYVASFLGWGLALAARAAFFALLFF